MNYRDLYGKKTGLVGTQKICDDIREFFGELDFKIIVDEKIKSETITQLDDCDYIIAGAEYQDIDEEVASNKKIITLTDIYQMVDELETFYIDKMFGNKIICVYGNEENYEKMIGTNPNLRVDYRITDHESSGCTFDQLKEMSDIFVILADEVNKNLKDKFTDIGLEFGTDFHFFNSRIPKHPTSYYLKKTLTDVPKFTIPCDYTTKALSVKAHGNVMACCSSVGLSLGNSLYTSIEQVLKGIQAQLICLSINNRTFSFCGDMCFMYREKKYRLNEQSDIENNKRKNIKLREIKDFNVQLGYDRSCNLACPSCRDHRIVKPEDDLEQVEMMHEEVKRMCSKKPRNVRIGNGELFFSPYYKDIIFNVYENKSIALISNGMLFTTENWKHLEDRYEDISLEVSIDAVNTDTYKKLRGGDLNKLRKNMEFAGQLRKEGKLKKFSISFVIQVDNFREMVDFVKYGRSINADYIHFMKLNSWGHIPAETFVKMDVYDERNEYYNEFVEILNNPIFMEPSVHVDNISNYIRSVEG